MKVALPSPRNGVVRFSLLGLGIALLSTGLLGGVAGGVAAQSFAVEGVTYGQPKVIPGEFSGDVRKLSAPPVMIEEPPIYRPLLRGPPPMRPPPAAPRPSAPDIIGGPLAPMPGPIQNFAGMSRTDSCTGGQCGSGWPPDTNGDVGPNHYILAVNTSIAIYSKNGTLLASFTENNLWSGVGTTRCNGSSRGDPVVIYDWLADRFVITWFAFASPGGHAASPFYQCIAASKTSDPVTGGWWLYAVRMDPGGPGLPPVGSLNDYAKFGLWHDCLYMAANEFAPSFAGVAFASFSRSDLYSGAPLTYSLGYLAYPANQIFGMVPSNNQGKGPNAVQPGTLNYFVSESLTAFSFDVRKFTPASNCGAGGTLSSATSVSQTSYSYTNMGAEVPQPNTAIKLDNIDDRIMQKVQYRKIGGAESLWVTHNVDTASGPTAMQWAQINVTGGTIATAPVQQQIYAPDTTLWRWMGSVAVDGQGNMALGYSTSGATSPRFPSIAYSGRLATDPLNTLPQTEVQLIAGAGSQMNTCGGAPCDRWGDYSSMSVDPADDCTFWYTNEYYSSQSNGTSGNWQTRIGSFKFPSCAAATSTTVASSLNPSIFGMSVTFTAAVTGTNPTGTVNFTDGGVSISGCAAAPLTGAGNTRTAECTTTSLSVGVHSIVAVYSGGGGNPAASSSPLSQTVLGVQVNVALASLGAVASASSTYSVNYPVAAVNNGDRTGAGWGSGGGWNDATAGVFPDFVQIVFNGWQTIDHVSVYTLQDNFASPVEPNDSMTFGNWGVQDFTVQGWNGLSWVTLGSVSGNNLVKRTVSFSAFTTDRIRVNIASALAGYSRIVEIEAFGVPASTMQSNVAAAALGAVASASSTFSVNYPVAAVNNGDRTGAGWGSGGGWNDATSGVFPDFVQIVFNGQKTIDHVIVYSLQDNFENPVEPADGMTFGSWGVTSFSVEGWNGSSWVTLGSVSENTLVKRAVSFSAFTTDRIRVNVNTALANYSRIVEIEAFGVPAGPEQRNVAMSDAGAVASASSTFSASYPVSAVNNGDRTGAGWGSTGGWNDATAGVFPDFVEIAFNGQKTIDHVIVYTLQDNFSSPVSPTDTMTFSTWGVTGFNVDGWNGSAWITLGTVPSNDLVKRTLSFSAFATDRIRVNVTNALNGYSRIVEIEAWGN
jgi:hypothetical protein